MAGIDRTVFNTREQLLSGDLNDLPALGGRVIMDAELYRACTDRVPTFTGVTELMTGYVLGGLQATGAAAGVSVSRGMLAQPWPGTGTAPSTADSPILYGRNNAAVDVVIPVPGADTYYLVQARTTETQTVTPGRLVWNPGLLAFAPAALLTRVENTIQFNVKVGTATNLPLPDAGYLPICGVLRRSTGAAPLASEIIDLRPLRLETIPTIEGEIDETFMITDPIPPPTTWRLNLAFSGRLPLLGRAYVSTLNTFVDMNNPVFLDPTTTLALGNQWLYIYLCSWGGTLPRGAYSALRSQGVFVLSSTPPPAQGDRLASGIALPAPFSLDLSPTTLCVGMVKTDSLGTYFNFMEISDRQLSFYLGEVAYTTPGGNLAMPAHVIPRNARDGVFYYYGPVGNYTIFDSANPGQVAMFINSIAVLNAKQESTIALRGNTLGSMVFNGVAGSTFQAKSFRY